MRQDKALILFITTLSALLVEDEDFLRLVHSPCSCEC